ncbi:MAG TPA: ABC transporter permease [Thermoanaerobaculia bacterium]|nr:ABC transporter permease [Thermoanaerobaculia bacterium]
MSTPGPFLSRLARLAVSLYPASLSRGHEEQWTASLLESWRSERRRRPLLYPLSASMLLAIDLLTGHRIAARLRRRRSRRSRESSMHTLLHDLRFTLRSLRRRPAFTLVAIVLLALGLAANTALWSVVHSVLLRPLPYGDPDRVVTLWSEWSNFDQTWLSMGEARLYRDRVDAFEDFAIYFEDSASFDDLDRPERTRALGASANLLSALGVEPQLGRGFTAEEAEKQRNVVILSSELWQRRYGGDPGLVGSTVGIEGERYDVVGVLPPGLDTPQDLARALHADAWFPLRFPEGTVELEHGGGNHGYLGVGRLREGVTVAELQAQLDAHVVRLAVQGVYPDTMGFRVNASSAADEVVGGLRTALLLFLGAVFMVLLVAVFNVAGLSITEGLRRTGELSLRRALGASGGRLVRQSLLEALVLSLLASGVGAALAAGALALFRRFAPPDLPRLDGVAITPFALGVGLLLSLVAAVLFGLWPALWTRRLANPSSRRATGGRGGRRARTLVTTLQVALSLVLVIGTALMARSLAGLLAVDPGFSTREAATFRVFMPTSYFPEAAEVVAAYERLLESLRSEPGVEGAGAVRLLPLASTMGDFGVRVEGYEPPPGEHPSAEWQSVTPGYFDALGIALVAGRDFDARDRSDSEQVVIVNEAFVRAYVPEGEVLGRGVRLGGGGEHGGDDERGWTSIVGVVADVRHDTILSTPKPTWYRPHTQFAASTGFVARSMTVVARTEQDAATLGPAIRRAADAADPRLAVGEQRTLSEVMASQVAGSRLSTFVLVAFAGTALVLATLGILGVLSHLARQRGREIAIRMAVGARPADAVSLVLGQGVRMLAAGLLLGIAGAIAVTRSLSNQLYGIDPLDLSTFAIALPVVALAGLVACSIPALRASRVQPFAVLHEE